MNLVIIEGQTRISRSFSSAYARRTCTRADKHLNCEGTATLARLWHRKTESGGNAESGGHAESVQADGVSN